MLVYALTIFLSAFLLFQVQPMIAKIILPWFGGSAAVWSTCMMYFQISLLLGYLYAHALIRYVGNKLQPVVHIGLLAISLVLLPVYPSAAWKPGGDTDPTLGIILLLVATIGLPYFLLSSTGPLLQAWYLRKSGAIPYRLFALSNLASLLALVTFPVAVEPFLTTHAQANVWSGVYCVFALLCAASAWITRRSPEAEQAASGELLPATRPSVVLQVLWVALAACASALLLGVTNQLSYNVAPIPFLWVLPLSVYLLSFILCFESERAYVRGVFVLALPFALGGMAYLIYAGQGNPAVSVAVPVFSAGLFVACMVCHGEVARLKPHPRYLTIFYLLIATGGALGGAFVALAAPRVFQTYAELPVSMVACAVLTALVLWNDGGNFRGLPTFQFRYAAAIFIAGLVVYMGYNHYQNDEQYRMSARNFYGSLRIRDQPETDTETAVRMLVHGTIIHGEQLLDATMRDTPTSYYGTNSGIGLAIRSLQSKGPLRVAVVGLGAGVLASYCRQGDFFRFYELNPLARQIASTWFTFVRDCQAQHDVLMGDARLVMERQQPQGYDVLALDAFASDAIPVHLLTREAFRLYFRHLKPHGILAVHISNKYLNLAPVVAADARALGKKAVVVHDDGGSDDYVFVTTWILVSSDPAAFQDPMYKDAQLLELRTDLRLWTDDYSNLVQILK